MLCDKCNKNQAIKTYTRTRGGKMEQVHYCLECAANLDTDACPYCGMSVASFTKTKLVGCAKCYETLSSAVVPVINRMQGAKRHTGKCAYTSEQERIRQRREELSALAERKYSENDDRGAGAYEEQIDRLLAGIEEDFVWKKN